MSKHWRIRPHDPDELAQLEKTAGVPPVVAQLLVNRGITDEPEVARFLEAPMKELRDPELRPGVNEAADLVMAAMVRCVENAEAVTGIPRPTQRTLQ